MRGVALAGVAAALVFAAAGSAAAPQKTVTIDADGFKPPVAIVGPGTDVTWRNDDTTKRSTVGGFWSSGELAPGASYTARFNRFGEFPYHDGVQPDRTGTVVVIAGTTRPGSARGKASYRYRATVSFAATETWEYWDSEWESKTGTCNAEVGKGSRVVRFTARIPLVSYTRIAGIEVLHTDRPAPTRLGSYRTTQDAKVAGNSRAVTCQNGRTTEAPADVDASCNENLAGKLLKVSIGWTPAPANKNKLYFTNSGGDIEPTPAPCGGPSHVGALVLLDVKNENLPLWLVGDRVLFDEGAAGPLTSAEVRALRAGRNVHIVRSLDLVFTAPCCVGYAPPTSNVGIFARIGAIITTKAKLDVRLTRRR